jgi:hypothetical protein
MGGLVFFVYALYYDVLAVTAVGGLATLLQIVVVVVLWAADLSKTPTSFLG